MMESYDERSYMTDNIIKDVKNIKFYQANSSSDSSIEKEKEKEKKPCISFSDLRDLKIEVLMFLYMFSYLVRTVTSTTLIMEKVCLVHLGYSKNVCSNLSDYPDQKTEVEKLANNYNMGLLMIQLLPASILSCFMGAWSDKYGRKIPIITALIGMILDGIISTICAFLIYSPVEYFLLSGIFSGFSGGLICVLTVMYSYAADTTTVNKRTMKYTMMEMAFGLAVPLGQLSGGWIYECCGYVPVFMTTTSGHILSLAWVVFVLDETKGLHSTDGWKMKFKRLWSTGPVIECFKATIKWRPNQGRRQILLLILSMGLIVLGSSSTVNISFMYVHHLYDWNNATYSTVSAIFSVVGTVAILICVPIFKRMKLEDPALGIAGTISLLVKNIGIGLATKPEIYFFANLSGLLTSLATLAGRSKISKVASKDDVGKVFAFVTTAESLVPILGIVIVSQIYNATVDIFPGLIYLALAFPLFIPLGVYMWIVCLPSVTNEETDDEVQINYDAEPDFNHIT